MPVHVKDLISIEFLSDQEIEEIYVLTKDIKKNKKKYFNALDKKVLAMIFEKPSLRTRFTFETGIYELGGIGVYLGPNDILLQKRESIYDVAKNLERWASGIMIRTFAHSNVTILAENTKIPVINGLDDLFHPCQAITDLFTFKEHKGAFEGRTLAYVGDGNNVAHSLMWASLRSGLNMNIAVPEGYEPNPEITKKVLDKASRKGIEIRIYHNPFDAVRASDAVYTDVWTSMGHEDEAEKRQKIFAPFQVTQKLMNEAKRDALFMHCLPAHRGEEVTDQVIDAQYSIVYDQAENRLHAQKAIMYLLMKEE